MTLEIPELRRFSVQALSKSIHVGARPITARDWRALLDAEGFNVRSEMLRPMRLLKPVPGLFRMKVSQARCGLPGIFFRMRRRDDAP